MIDQKLNISIIIPTLNEEDIIQHTCDKVVQMGNFKELLIVDGNSRDNTPQLASRYGSVISSRPGRAIQMNTGARMATGDILWFLHADCLPHPESLRVIHSSLEDNNIVGGAFAFLLDSEGILYRLAESLSNFKNRIFTLFYGEMGIFVRKSVFQKIGGYHEIPIMEDIDLCRRLKKVGKVVILPQHVLASARRWKSEGPMKNIIRNWLLQLGWLLGISPQNLVKYYPSNNNE